jgi:hypothetical protein
MQRQTRPQGRGFSGQGHPGSLVKPASWFVLSGRPDSDPLTAHRARYVENVEEQREPNSGALRSGTHEHHRDVEERRIQPARSIVESSGLCQRHAYDSCSRRYKRQCIWG